MPPPFANGRILQKTQNYANISLDKPVIRWMSNKWGILTMALIVLSKSVDMTAINEAGFAGGTAFSQGFFTFTCFGNFPSAITALSAFDDITAVSGISFIPTAGTINAIFSQNGNSEFAYSILGLTVNLIDLVDTSSAITSNERYWETILAGVTEFTDDANGVFNLTGDFLTVSATESVTGAADSFVFTGLQQKTIAGDAFTVNAAATLTGGRDIIKISNNSFVSLQLAGDVVNHLGTVNGGNDTIVVNAGISAGSQISGDAFKSDGVLIGGADRITLNLVPSIATPDYSVTGDAIDALREVTGGNDTINISSISDERADVAIELSGDVKDANTASSVVIAGNDRITVTNVSGVSIAGDVNSQSNGTTIAGNDKIIVNSSSGATIAGDVLVFTGGTLTPGQDTILGGDGDDIIFGESATPGFPTTVNTIVNAGGNDVINGRGGNDQINGQVGNDRITGGAGNDVIDGGSGIDTAQYNSIAAAVFVDLIQIGVSNLNAIGQGFDDLVNIENITGSTQSDTIKGDNIDNVLAGLAGDDILVGQFGNDTLRGGTGIDILIGGNGEDIYDFNSVKELGTTANSTDEIRGFATGDKIDISGIDANEDLGGNQDFVITTSLTGAGQITITQNATKTIIRGSTDADTDAEFMIVLNAPISLTAADFVL